VNILQVEEKLGYTFRDKSLLQTALTHTSYANERKCVSYERLEFLGDSVLGYVTAEFLFQHEPPIPEGRMTRLRSELVCENSLFRISDRLGMGEHLLLGKGEERSGGRARVSVLADIIEACIAAMYLDGGLEPAKSFIYRELLDLVEIDDFHSAIDYKTHLQEIVQANGPCTICYSKLSESGPDHCKCFEFNVSVNGTVLGTGSGRSKKEAEEAAACAAIEKLNG